MVDFVGLELDILAVFRIGFECLKDDRTGIGVVRDDFDRRVFLYCVFALYLAGVPASGQAVPRRSQVHSFNGVMVVLLERRCPGSDVKPGG